MAITFPLSRAAFLDLVPSLEVKFWLGRQDQHTGLGGGQILSAEVAPPLWRGSVPLPPMKKREADELVALLEALEVPGRRFEAFKVQQIGPASDPLGVGLAGFAPLIYLIDNADPQRLRLSGLPEGYELRRGDMLSFAYDPGNGVRQALHRVVDGGIASASGRTPYLTVNPPIRPGADAETAVDLVKPFCLAGVVPGSVSYGTTKGNVTTGIGFDFQQSLRR